MSKTHSAGTGFFSVILLIAMCCSLCACGSAKTSPTAMVSTADYAGGAAYEFDVEEAYYDGENGFAAATQAYRATGSETEPSDDPERNQEKIIYSADVTVETTEFDDATGRVSELVQVYHGYIESSSVSGSDYYKSSRGVASKRSATYTLRIPSESFDVVMAGFSELGNVPYSHTYTENVTSQYYDTQARMTVYQAQETRLLELMETAETIEDIIVLEDRLAEVRYQIESMQTKLKSWDRRVSYSTITLTLKEVQKYTPEEIVNPTFWDELKESAGEGVSKAANFLRDLLLWLLENIWILLIVGILLYLVVRLVSWIRKKHGPAKSGKRRLGRKKSRESIAGETSAAPGDTSGEEQKKRNS